MQAENKLHLLHSFRALYVLQTGGGKQRKWPFGTKLSWLSCVVANLNNDLYCIKGIFCHEILFPLWVSKIQRFWEFKWNEFKLYSYWACNKIVSRTLTEPRNMSESRFFLVWRPWLICGVDRKRRWADRWVMHCVFFYTPKIQFW